jgi:hypothetical protein
VYQSVYIGFLYCNDLTGGAVAQVMPVFPDKI